MRRSVCLALVASLMHGKASGSPRPPLLTRDPGHILGGFGRPAQGPGSGARARQGDRAVMPGEGEPRASVLRRLGGGGPWQGAWGAPPPAFPEQPARLSSPEVSLQGEFQRKLYKDLVKNYNPLERPVANDSQPLTVYFSLSLLQIMDVDEKNQVLTTNIWLQMSWTDHYLQWNMSEYPGVKTVRFPDGQIWKPDILLYNSILVKSGHGGHVAAAGGPKIHLPRSDLGLTLSTQHEVVSTSARFCSCCRSLDVSKVFVCMLREVQPLA
uniref:Cholinergic receptor nicotinic alpha 7 subunit n=1 Tax=Sus scrofa TaxID=9823 RepID=A0A8D1M438_PIG